VSYSFGCSCFAQQTGTALQRQLKIGQNIPLPWNNVTEEGRCLCGVIRMMLSGRYQNKIDPWE
jgi:hypothetical protein